MKDFLKRGEYYLRGLFFLRITRLQEGDGRGKSFYSQGGMGLYFSIFTRPKDNQGNAMLITTHAAVAVVRAIEEALRNIFIH